MNRTRQPGWDKKAAYQIRAIARLLNQRLVFGLIYPGRRARGVAVAAPLAITLGYYSPPLQGFQLAASPTVSDCRQWFVTTDELLGSWSQCNFKKKEGIP